jgi:hypothetical protein
MSMLSHLAASCGTLLRPLPAAAAMVDLTADDPEERKASTAAENQ